MSGNPQYTREASGLGYLYAMISAILFGLMPLFTKIAYRYGSNPYTVSFMRFFYTALACGVLMLFFPKGDRGITRRELRWIALLAVFYAAMALFLYGSYSYIDSALATALHFSYPVVVMLLSVVILRVPLSALRVLCVSLCMCGIVLMTQSTGERNMTGMLFAFLSGVSLALYVVFLTKSGLNDMPMIKMVFWLSLFTALYLFLFAVVSGKLLVRLPWQAHAAQCLLALCCTMFAMALFQKSVSMIGGVRTSLLSTLEPIVSVVVGVAVFHEVLTTRILCGMVLILLSAVLLVRARA